MDEAKQKVNQEREMFLRKIGIFPSQIQQLKMFDDQRIARYVQTYMDKIKKTRNTEEIRVENIINTSEMKKFRFLLNSANQQIFAKRYCKIQNIN
ncbi:unnamed protein product [Paramecium octaurelia]|uniref:Uncharacterized protein n=1 Tax=Paramecium octaurelia TaxID=43137 RepID=A0A8S1XLR8_PAROT|nr:unnamed protein product [Paramecium octaurelia]